MGLLWSTRKRRDVVVDHPGWTFAQIAKWISDEWKKIDADEKDELQKEAEEMNELGIRKLPRDDDHGGPHPESDAPGPILDSGEVRGPLGHLQPLALHNGGSCRCLKCSKPWGQGIHPPSHPVPHYFHRLFFQEDS